MMRSCHRLLIAVVILAAGVCAARTFRRSFKNGYPAEWNVSEERAGDSFAIKNGSVKYSDGRGMVISHSATREIVGKVTRVSDGDTVWVNDKLGRHKVRLNRIDAPESDQPFGKESAAHLKSLIGGREVRVEHTGTDQYGRVLGIIFLGETDINLQMVRDGCAWHYSHFDKTPAYAAAERDARVAKRGLWASPSPVNPYLWRKGKRESVAQVNEVNGHSGASRESGHVEYRPGGAMPVGSRKAAPVCADWPETGYWLSTNSMKRHNRRCENYRKTRGYPCRKDEGDPCGKCGG